MKKLKPFLVAFIIFTISQQLHAQKVKDASDEPIGKLITMKGEEFTLFKKVSMTSEDVSFFTDGDKFMYKLQSNIKWMTVYNRIYFCLPFKTGKRLVLMEVLAMNKKYFLAQYWWDWYYYYIFDYEGNMIMSKRKVFNRGKTIGSGNNNEKVLEDLKGYFSDCPELINAMTNNLNNKEMLSQDIVNTQCGDTPPLQEVISKLEEKIWSK